MDFNDFHQYFIDFPWILIEFLLESSGILREINVGCQEILEVLFGEIHLCAELAKEAMES